LTQASFLQKKKDQMLQNVANDLGKKVVQF
jgi:hypothetical protein